MEKIVNVLKIVAGLIIGIIIGLVIAGIIIVVFTDTTFMEFINSFRGFSIGDAYLSIFVAILSLAVSVFFLVILHEAGHLVCGLLSGYSFVSFRIFNFTFIRLDGKLRVKRFSIAGTGGQCLMSPPDLKLEDIPVVLYNAGGVLVNLLVILVVIPLLFLDNNPYVMEFLSLMLIVDVFMLIVNGIPMKVGGMGNDAYYILSLRKSMKGKRGFVVQLRSNALIQEGVRPKDMPEAWFKESVEIDYGNALEVCVPIMRASRYVDMEKWEEAFAEFEKLYSHKSEIIPIYVKEIACELVFIALVTGRRELAESLLDDELRKYIENYRKVMSSKERVLLAIALYLEGDIAKARSIYTSLENNSSNYLLQGEVKSDLALMNSQLQRF